MMSDSQSIDPRFQFVKLDRQASEVITAPKYSYWGSVFKQFFSHKVAIVMLVLLALVLGMSFIQPLFSGYDFMNTDTINDFSKRYNYPSWGEWFGTDPNGQSLFDAVWAGARTSIAIAVLATLITEVIGITVGMIWGNSKKIDRFMLEVYNVVANVPTLVIVLVLAFAFGRGFWNLLLAMTVTTWVGSAFGIRVQTMIIRDREYNLASRALGTPTRRLLTKNMLPYLISYIVTDLSNIVPVFISLEVFLSFLGVGLPANVPSLGRLISQYATNLTNYSYLFWIPVGVLALVSMTLYIVGQTLADAADPRTHR
ncbi:MAG: ABC transporter permease [Microbacterium sp.]